MEANKAPVGAPKGSAESRYAPKAAEPPATTVDLADIRDAPQSSQESVVTANEEVVLGDSQEDARLDWADEPVEPTPRTPEMRRTGLAMEEDGLATTLGTLQESALARGVRGLAVVEKTQVSPSLSRKRLPSHGSSDSLDNAVSLVSPPQIASKTKHAPKATEDQIESGDEEASASAHD